MTMATTETVTETRYRCGQCKRTHSTIMLAQECCVCSRCQKRPATHNEQGEVRDARRYGVEWCASCWRARRVRALRDKCVQVDSLVAECKKRLDEAERAAAAVRAELEALTPSRAAAKPATVGPRRDEPAEPPDYGSGLEGEFAVDQPVGAVL
jgi:hypothetical protein